MTSLGETRVRTAQGLQQVGEHDEDSCSVASPLVLEEVAGSGEDYVIPLLGAGLALPLVG